MSEKRFTIHKENMYKEDWYAYPFCIKEDGEVVLETIPSYIAEKVRDKLNEQDEEIKKLKRTERSWRKIHCCNKESDNCGIVIEQQATIQSLKEENEQLRKERDYWETSSKHRQRLLEDTEKELRLHNAYLIDNNLAEDYQRWRRSNK